MISILINRILIGAFIGVMFAYIRPYENKSHKIHYVELIITTLIIGLLLNQFNRF